MGVALMVKDQTYAELNERIKTLEKELQQRVQTETDLLEQEQKYRLIFEKARDAIFIIQNDVIRFANRRARTVLGYTDEELSTTAIAKLIHPKDRDLVAARHLKRLKGDKVPGTHSFRVISKTGKEIWVEHTAVRVSWEGQPGTLNFVRNITQKKKLDAQLQFAARLEAIGTLAGGIAHSFNNLLMGIQGHTSLLLLDIDSTHPHYADLKKIENAVQGGAELTSQLIGYARKGRYRSKSIAINEIIENTSQTFQKMKREITIHLELTQRPHAIEADQGQMEQMLLNLYINAADAMPDGGEIYLKTKNVTHRDIKSRLYEARPGKYVRLTVSDRGVGIDKKIQHRIFDPFFTTKTIGKGTGLGLASVYGIVKSHEGYINVESKRGRGTTFFIYLPAADKRKKKK
ncbi:MAG: PAS domain S-box protein [Desulfobacterales bacterium]|jgi:PAS domain S-box-containing protein|nr:PAS domain S-box protein [Desulfobacterales bacterium]